MEAQWNWVDERRGNEKVATTFSRSFAENGEPRTARQLAEDTESRKDTC